MGWTFGSRWGGVWWRQIRLQIDSSYASPFNVEEFEVEWRPEAEPPLEWTSVGRSDLTARTVARLKPDTPYQFRVRAWNHRGCSGWTAPVSSRTKLDPTVADGGGYGPGGPDKSYSWSQTASEVCVHIKLPLGSTKKDVSLVLKSDSIMVIFRGEVRLEGELFGTVRGLGNGSTWYVERERDHMVLVVSMEKQVKSLAPKFDYWRSLVLGHPEIDTHQIVSDGQATRMLDPGQLDPYQLQNMGLGHLSGGAPRSM
ncbi:hypothetical protein VOLCADRAFT_90254 [Volvox carteri f. nagariensis]|uniref:Fibronectin type-III domain-containing protein n=1 Tax=Volvox carteri f. nagariensis TaxID=3068 RepID=D8TTW1_VOLCA|nr:uncharacterized protein VOLCADRAFT_90254 [Volvox carteri f. nagariensis]EFJ49036.1 hypothetical protein VOLCADRAFT_90254 [Volvox carteri f. nagariensis]|eukprot:XP_002949933.1 hypothetical protein VOLCADRAFT_90254 [Volvox carteri f. nagariensis]